MNIISAPSEPVFLAELEDFLHDLFAELKAGHAVTIVPLTGSFNTWEAATILDLPHTALVRAITTDALPHTGSKPTKWRILGTDLLALKADRDAENEAAMDAPLANSPEIGVYK